LTSSVCLSRSCFTYEVLKGFPFCNKNICIDCWTWLYLQLIYIFFNVVICYFYYYFYCACVLWGWIPIHTKPIFVAIDNGCGRSCKALRFLLVWEKNFLKEATFLVFIEWYFFRKNGCFFKYNVLVIIVYI